MNPKRNAEFIPTKKRYFAAGVAGRLAGNAVRRQQRSGRKTISVKLIDRIGNHLSKPKRLDSITDEKVKQVFGTTKYWHGTGRYQYKEGKRVDVLDFIVKHRALIPQYDGLDLTGPMNSLSFAKSRMYARAYADMHGKGSREQNRYGSSTFWAWTFAGDIYIELIKETKLWRRRNRQLSRKHFREGGAHDWPSKVSTTNIPVPEIFNRGSDIEGNYPVLFGIRDKAFEPVPTSRALAIHEMRSHLPLSLTEDVTHIEVPESAVAEVSSLFQQNGLSIPILAIEDCERYASELPFSKLVSGI